MDLLKRELERKKKALQVAADKAAVFSPSSNPSTNRSTRYLSVGALRRLQEEEEDREKEQQQQQQQETELAPAALDGAQQETQQRNDDKKRGRTEDNSTADGHKSSKISKKEINSSDDHTKLDAEKDKIKNSTNTTECPLVDERSSLQLSSELRRMGIPVRLFGETDTARQQRLETAKKAQQETLLTLTEMEEFRLGQGHGIRNPFLEKKKKSLDEDDADTKLHHAEITQKQQTPKEKEKIINEEDSNDPHKRIYRYFKDLLREWEDDLNQRPDEVKRTVAGKNDTKTHKQCKDYVRPLFKLCKSRKLEEGLLAKISKIVDYCQQGEFVKAHDAYMDVAIGRAAWPIGVTMVGIHARTGRAKIESQNVAHVMNSELQRKYLTSVKRLMTFAQSKRTDVNPSKKVIN